MQNGRLTLAVGNVRRVTMLDVVKYPSMKAKAFVALLCRELGYEIYSQKGSHRKMRSSQHPDILFSYHDGDTVPPGVVKHILLKQVGLTEEEARNVLGI